MTCNSTVWQVAAGETQYDFSDVCLDNDVMLIGWGWFGPYGSRRFRRAKSRYNSSGIGTVTRFATDPKRGDVVLLRSGKRAISIGLVARGGYSFQSEFKDVHGILAQNTQRVIWQHHLHEPLSRLQERKPLFADFPRMSTFTQIWHPGILRKITPLVGRCRWRGLRKIRRIQGMSLPELKRALSAGGIPDCRAAAICTTVQESRDLFRFYSEDEVSSSEHEIEAHIVIPLLRALGWKNECIGVEWNHMDVVVFHPVNKEVLMVFEAKHIDRNLDKVIQQPMRYCGRNKLQCGKIVVTNGRWYYLYKRYRGQGRWRKKLLGRLDLENIMAEPSPSSPMSGLDILLQIAPRRRPSR